MFSLRVTSNIYENTTFAGAGGGAYGSYVRLLNQIGSDRLLAAVSYAEKQPIEEDVEAHVKEIFPRSTTSPSHNVEEFGERMYEGFFAWAQLSRAAMIVELRHRLGKKRRPAMILDILDRGKAFKQGEGRVRSIAVFERSTAAAKAQRAGYGGFSGMAEMFSKSGKVFLRPGVPYNLGAMQGTQWRSRMQRYITDVVLARLQRRLNRSLQTIADPASALRGA